MLNQSNTLVPRLAGVAAGLGWGALAARPALSRYCELVPLAGYAGQETSGICHVSLETNRRDG